jgi:hypothetical protein
MDCAEPKHPRPVKVLSTVDAAELMANAVPLPANAVLDANPTSGIVGRELAASRSALRSPALRITANNTLPPMATSSKLNAELITSAATCRTLGNTLPAWMLA